MIAIRWSLPIRLESAANLHESHWRQRADRVKRERMLASMVCRTNLPDRWHEVWSRATVTLTRSAPRELDSDNLASAFKAIRDGIADALELNDADPRLTWRYEQTRGRPREYSVQVEIALAEAGGP